MPSGSSKKRERQYEHIKKGAEKRGVREGRAEEIAARTVNKDRARTGESRTASKQSQQGPSPERRGGKRSQQQPGKQNYDQLYAEAKQRGVHGRSSMSKDQLKKELGYT